MFSSASAANDNSVELIIGGGRRRNVRQCWATMRSNSPRDASNTAGEQKNRSARVYRPIRQSEVRRFGFTANLTPYTSQTLRYSD